MKLNEIQQQAIDDEAAIPITIGNSECIDLSRKSFDRMIARTFDDSDWTTEEMRTVLSQTMQDAWNDPAMDVYDEE